MHKKYTYKKGKKYGPYLYENKRVGERIVTKYMGKENAHVGINKKQLVAYFLIFIAAILFVVSFNISKSSPTGKVSLEINNVKYNEGEALYGVVNFNLKKGEFIPSDSIVKVKLDGTQREYKLKDLIKRPTRTGNYYAENSQINGSGEGYGQEGEKREYPQIEFELAIINSTGSEEIVSGKVSKGNDFVYSGDYSSYSFVSGSVKVEGEEADFSTISSEDNKNEIRITTNYEIIKKGYGQEYLGEYGESLNINVEKLDLAAKDDALRVELVYGGEVMAYAEKDIEIKNENDKDETENESEINEEDVKNSPDTLYIVRDIPAVKIPFGRIVTVNLNDYILNADYFSVEVSEDIKISMNSGLLSLSAVQDFKGSREAKVTAYSGNDSISTTFQIIVSSTNINIKTSRGQIRLGQPVKWTKEVSLEAPEEISVEIPKEAENVEVINIDNDAEVINPEISSMTGNVVIEIDLKEKKESEFFLTKFFKNIFNSITGNAVADINVNEALPSEEIKEVVINDSVTEYTIEYETPAPQAIEKTTDRGKEVIISAPDNLGYTDIISFTDIPEIYNVGEESSIKIYWVEENEYVDFDAYDMDGNGKLDYVEWITPHLSEQTFEIILNAQSTPGDINSCQILDTPGTYTLTSDIDNYVGTCFNITADNVALNGNGHYMDGDDSGNDYGIYIYGRLNISLTDIIVTDFKDGIYFEGSSNNRVNNVTINSSTSSGLSVYSTNNSQFYNITSNNNGYDGLIIGQSMNNIFVNINATLNSIYGVYIGGSWNNTLYGIYTVLNLNKGVYLGGSLNNTLYNVESYSNANEEIYSSDWSAAIDNYIVYNSTYGQIEFKPLSMNIEGVLRFGNGMNINIINNSAYINSSSDINEFNVSANITFYGIGERGYIDPKILKDGILCSDCYNFTALNASTVIFNVTGWSSYSIGEELYYDVTQCGNLVKSNAVYTLKNNIISNGTCFNVTAENITLDGQGFKVIGNGSGYGIEVFMYSTNKGNVTLKNVNISNFTTGAISVFPNTDEIPGSSFNIINSFVSSINSSGSLGVSDYGTGASDGGSIYILDSTAGNIYVPGGLDLGGSSHSGNGGKVTLVNSSANNIYSYGTNTSSFSIYGGNGGEIVMVNSSVNNIYSYGGQSDSGIGGYGGSIYSNDSYINTIYNYGGMSISGPGGIGGNVIFNVCPIEPPYIDNSGGLGGDGNGGPGTITPSDCSGPFRITLNSCQILDQANMLYKLTNNIDNIVGTCFNITADNVTLNGNGHYIDGDDSGNDYGIYLLAGGNGGNIWNFANITDFNVGIYMQANSINLFNLSTNSNNGDGIYLSGSGCNVKNITSNSNSGNGAWFAIGNSELKDITTKNNTGNGIYFNTVSNSQIYNLTSIQNINGIYFEYAGNNNFYNINSTGNMNGIILNSGTNNIFYNTQSYLNSVYGISLVSSGNTFINSSTYNNSIGVFISEDVTGNKFYDLDSYFNTNQEIDLGKATSSAILIYNNSFGEIKLKTLTVDVEGYLRFGGGMNVNIINNSAYINSSSDISELNISANVTLYGIGNRGYSNPKILKDGLLCTNCYNYTALNASTVIFNVSSWSNYSIGDVNPYLLTECANLSEANATYNLTRNINSGSSPCFNITADNVTLNGNGYQLVGSSNGISISNKKGITIRDLRMTNDYGLNLVGVNQSTFENITASYCAVLGIYVSNSYNNLFRKIDTSGSDMSGIEFYSSSNNTLENFTADGNVNGGLILGTFSRYNYIMNPISIQDSGNKILLDSTSENNKLGYNNSFGEASFALASDSEYYGFNSNSVNITNGTIKIDQSLSGNFFNVVMRQRPGANLYEPQLLLDGQSCDGMECTLYSNIDDEIVIFDASSAGTYTVSGSVDPFVLNECGTLNIAGGIYTLNQSITGVGGNCFNITEDNITLRGNNIYEIVASYPSNGYGIIAENVKNVTIKDMKISAFKEGMRLGNISNSTIRSNYIGASTRYGINITGSSNNNIYGNDILSNIDYQIVIGAGSTENYFVNNTLSSLGKSIIDRSGNSNYNYLIYRNSYGEIVWNDIRFLRNLTTDNDIELGKSIIIESNKAGINTNAFTLGTTRINTGANITLYNAPTYSSFNGKFKEKLFGIKLNGGMRCTNCYNFTSLNAGNVMFNVSEIGNNYSIGLAPRSKSEVKLGKGWNLFGLTMDENYSEGTNVTITLKPGRNYIGYSGAENITKDNIKATLLNGTELTWGQVVSQFKGYNLFGYYESNNGRKRFKYAGLDDNNLRVGKGYIIDLKDDAVEDINITFIGAGGSLTTDTYAWADLMFMNETSGEVKNVSEAWSAGWLGYDSTDEDRILEYWYVDPEDPNSGPSRRPISDLETVSSWEAYELWSRSEDIILLRQD